VGWLSCLWYVDDGLCCCLGVDELYDFVVDVEVGVDVLDVVVVFECVD